MAGALDRLARLRAIGERSAKLDLSRCLGARAAAAAEAEAAAAAIAAEAACDPQAFARWLPSALAARERRRAQERLAAAAAEAARRALAEAHTARAVVDEALAGRLAEAERLRLVREQGAIDDLVQRRRAGGTAP